MVEDMVLRLTLSVWTLYHHDVMGVKVGTKWKIYMETSMFCAFKFT